MRIVKNGLYNEVGEDLFKAVYEKKGWKRVNVERVKDVEINEKNEQKVLELSNNKLRQKQKKFNDNIIKE